MLSKEEFLNALKGHTVKVEYKSAKGSTGQIMISGVPKEFNGIKQKQIIKGLQEWCKKYCNNKSVNKEELKKLDQIIEDANKYKKWLNEHQNLVYTFPKKIGPHYTDNKSISVKNIIEDNLKGANIGSSDIATFLMLGHSSSQEQDDGLELYQLHHGNENKQTLFFTLNREDVQYYQAQASFKKWFNVFNEKGLALSVALRDYKATLYKCNARDVDEQNDCDYIVLFHK